MSAISALTKSRAAKTASFTAPSTNKQLLTAGVQKAGKAFKSPKRQRQELDALLTKLVRKGQPLTHIYATHKDEIPVSLRSLYTYIDSGKLTIRNIDLQRKTSYKPRKKGHEPNPGFQNQAFRKGRTYADFEKLMKVSFCDNDVVEMDTVKGVRETGKRLLTMIFRKNSVMLLFLMPNGKAESVKRVFGYLEAGLSLDVFRRLFPVILTDNGSEFKHVDGLEYSDELEYRTGIFYCDPMASWQKPHIEKNHEFIRYAIPKGKNLSCYTQKDISLLMNHINSTTRPSLNNKSTYSIGPFLLSNLTDICKSSGRLDHISLLWRVAFTFAQRLVPRLFALWIFMAESSIFGSLLRLYTLPARFRCPIFAFHVMGGISYMGLVLHSSILY